MGMSRQRRTAFFAKHPMCIFCGGRTKAETIEHCPPRAMFQHRAWPEGFEFAACSTCNHGTADQDLLVALLARSDPFTDAGNADGRMPGIIGSVHQQFPGLVAKMMPSAVQARQINRRLGISPAQGMTNQEAGAVRVTDEMDTAVQVFAAKLTKGIYYLQTAQPFPAEGGICMRWFTNSELISNNGQYPLLQILANLDGLVPELTRANSLLNDQFEYKLSISHERDLLALQARFGRGFGFVVFACTDREKLDAVLVNVESKTGKPNPFVRL